MVKAYFDYIQSHVFGLANRNSCVPVYIAALNSLVLGCAELALIVNLKSGEVTRKLDCKKKSYVSCIQLFENSFNRHLAIGFEDGDIAVYDLTESAQKLDDEEFFLFSEHDAAVTSIAFNSNGAFMASGSMENVVILWDVIGRSVKHKFTGHSAPVTSVRFFKNFKDSSDYILSSSKDGCLRVWDIDTRRCIDIITSKKNEVLAVAPLTSSHLKFVRNELFVATTNSEEIVFYEMKVIQSAEAATKYHEERDEDKSIEILKVRSKAEVANKFKRKKKRALDKQGDQGDEAEGAGDDPEAPEGFEKKEDFMNNLTNWFETVKTLKLKSKADSIKFIPKYKNFENLLVINYSNHTFEVRQVTVGEGETSTVELTEFASFENLGHQSVVRSLCFNRDDTMLLSSSADVVKVWSSLMSFQNTRTFQLTDIVSTHFLPLQQFACLGSRGGDLHLVNCATGVVEFSKEKAHADTIWNIDSTAIEGKLTIGTSSSDGTIKFWDFNKTIKTKQFVLELARSVTIGEPVQWLRFNHGSTHYAAALMDNSVQIRYFDTDRLFVSLYGHKMPVLCLDYSTDDTLIVTGSSDKYIKVWGTDFGDCHFSLLAHSSAVTQVKFVKDTHYIFTTGRDGSLRYWDADQRVLIKEFLGANSQDIWALAVSSIGDFIITGGKEKILRCHKQTKEQVFPHIEDSERKEKTILDNFLKDTKEGTEAGALGKRDYESLKHGEDIIQAIVDAEKMREEYTEYETELVDWKKAGSQGPKPAKPDLFKLSGAKSIPE